MTDVAAMTRDQLIAQARQDFDTFAAQLSDDELRRLVLSASRFQRNLDFVRLVDSPPSTPH